ncbi:MAG: hypothetical protein ABJH98_12990 [Reichenbachiella sp.]|uniref:hypothetical protein n=1 Tax=Reichenbachiella sp. TaxID=2184521 RepID=UPI003297EECB
MKKNIIVLLSMLTFSIGAMAQPPGRMDPNEMIAREKQNIYKKITDLSDDQKLLIDGIYEEFGDTMIETRKEMRNGNVPREQMREKMMSTLAEKDALMADVLNEDQLKIYDEMMASNKKQMEQMRQKRQQQGQGPQGDRGQDGDMNPSPDN